MNKQQTNPENLLSAVYRDPKYNGKHIIIINGQIYASNTGRSQTKLLEKLLDKYPYEVPLIIYIPKEDTLILLLI